MQTVTDQIIIIYNKESIKINLVIIDVDLILKRIFYVLKVNYNYISINALFKKLINVYFYYI